MYAADTDAAPDDDDDGAARERGGGALRFVVAEDAANAVNAPSSFDVTIAQLWVEGNNVSATRSYIGAHQTPADAGRCLDDEELDWASSALVFAVVDTTAEWPWAECTPRDPGAFTEATARGQLRFEAELRRAVLAVEDSADGRWFVRFAGDPRPPGPGPVDQFRSGVVVYVQYTLCGHLMEIPLTVESLGLSRS